jgi:adenylyl-sulfate kinase
MDSSGKWKLNFLEFSEAAKVRRMIYPSRTIWLTGLSGSGKSTTAQALREYFEEMGASGVVIDGDALRSGLSSDLGFDVADRDENVRRAGEIAVLANQQGITAIVALISPRAGARALVRRRHSDLGLKYFEVHMSTRIEVCEARDHKFLYSRARAGSVSSMTGVDAVYEIPDNADVVVSSEELSTSEIVSKIIDVISANAGLVE